MVDTVVWDFFNWDARFTRDTNPGLHHDLHAPQARAYHLHHWGVVAKLDFDRQGFSQSKDYFTSRKNKVPFSMAIGSEELLHECFPKHSKHSRMGTARMKKDKETFEEGKK